MRSSAFLDTAVVKSALRLAKRPDGVMTVEISSIFGSVATSHALQKLVKMELLFPAKLAHRSYRYFGTQAEAAFFAAQLAKPKAPAQPVVSIGPKQSPKPGSGKLAPIGMGARSHATWSRAREGEPGYIAPTLPTDAHGRPLDKVTVAPPLPSPAHTNTFEGMA